MARLPFWRNIDEQNAVQNDFRHLILTEYFGRFQLNLFVACRVETAPGFVLHA